jgi:AcrR family transcriptional regulator
MPKWTRKTAEVRQREILQAAERLLIQYGDERFSLAAIATEAGLSKTALYMHFESREQLFRAFTEYILEAPMLRAQEEAKSEGSLEDRVFRLLNTKIGHFYRVSRASPHGGWLIELTNQLSADLLKKDRQAYERLLARVLSEAEFAGRIDPSIVGLTANTLSATLISAAHGLAREDAAFVSERVFAQRLRGLVRAAVKGVARSS